MKLLLVFTLLFLTTLLVSRWLLPWWSLECLTCTMSPPFPPPHVESTKAVPSLIVLSFNAMTSSKCANFPINSYGCFQFIQVLPCQAGVSCKGKIIYWCICGARVKPWGGTERERKESWARGALETLGKRGEVRSGDDYYHCHNHGSRFLVPKPLSTLLISIRKPGFPGLGYKQSRRQNHGCFGVPSSPLSLATVVFASALDPALIFCCDFVCWFPGYIHTAKKHLKQQWR